MCTRLRGMPRIFGGNTRYRINMKMTASLAGVNPYLGKKGSDVDLLRGDLYKYSVCGKTLGQWKVMSYMA